VWVSYADNAHRTISFVVEDNGAGFTQERLAEVRAELAKGDEDTEKLSSVYGLYNVNKKLKLYYAEDTSGLIIESEAGKGSRVSFTVPAN
jgi:two-component system sensor histidine kinase YesM